MGVGSRSSQNETTGKCRNLGTTGGGDVANHGESSGPDRPPRCRRIGTDRTVCSLRPLFSRAKCTQGGPHDPRNFAQQLGQPRETPSGYTHLNFHQKIHVAFDIGWDGCQNVSGGGGR